ncbi:ATP-dependent DNA helicase RecQ [Elusimicrobium posterum]|uniref:DNA helicase RecQ n=1 Tax=Elusimicrobium posterum TaxID=3116653 RepID=UPI003C77F97A
MKTSRTPLEILNKVYGYSSFIGLQEPVIENIMQGKSALILMPTGGGKSLCYQIPALCMKGTAVVISPLISLMHDQVTALKELGIKAAALNSMLDFEESYYTERDIVNGELDLLYVSPERVVTPKFLDILNKINVALFAIDEAHCISEWGHDFRPEYAQLSTLRDLFPSVPVLALTATADEVTRKDIIKNLKIADSQIFISSFDRPNIEYTITPKETEKKQLLDFIKTKHHTDSGIVYCLSRKRTESVAEFLREKGYNALVYHAGLSKDTREKNQNRFIKEDNIIMVATNAFGMGINKPNVRFVAHMDLPKSIEAYYQETGRAGRDGLPADAWMVYGIKDIVLLRNFIESSGADEKQKRIEHIKLNALVAYAETTQCRRHILLKYFGQQHKNNCEGCDNCITPPVTYDATVDTQKFLSCIFRAGREGFSFGAGHIIDILMGKESEKIKKFGHDKLSPFAIGKDVSEAQWKTLSRQIIITGLAEVDAEHSTLSLSPAARAVLKGEQKVEFRKHVLMPKKKGEKKSKKSNILETEADNILLDKLKVFRRALAEKENIPSYIVFSDKSLIDMAVRKPKTMGEFADINGVGEFKLAKYGEMFLAEINS